MNQSNIVSRRVPFIILLIVSPLFLTLTQTTEPEIEGKSTLIENQPSNSEEVLKQNEAVIIMEEIRVDKHSEEIFEKPIDLNIEKSKQQVNDNNVQVEITEFKRLDHPDPVDHHHVNRNYASKECGAKVLFANEEAENKGAILNDPERDDYMRNPCEKAQNKFLIIELCETIQATYIELANFELFSSSPKDFRLYGSERYPTQDWALLGEFQAQDTRQIQRFEIPQRVAYAKFVKLELLSHHGKEHYCTLSTMRIFGISMVDEYEAEAATQKQPIVADFLSTTTSPESEIVVLDDLMVENSQTKLADLKKKAQEEDPLYDDYDNNSSITDSECNAVEGIDVPEDFTIAKSTSTRNQPKDSNSSDPSEQTKISSTQSGINAAGDVLKKIVNDFGANIKGVIKGVGTAFGKSKDGSETNGISSANKNQKRSMRLPSFNYCRQCSSNANFHSCVWYCYLFNKTRLIDKHNLSRMDPGWKSELGKDLKEIARKKNSHIMKNAQLFFLRRIGAAHPRISIFSCGLARDKNGRDLGTKKVSDERSSIQEGQKQVGIPANPKSQMHQQLQRPVIPKVVDRGNGSPLPGTSTNHKESVFMKLNKRLSSLETNMSLCNEFLLELTRRFNSETKTANEKVEKIISKFNMELKTLNDKVEMMAKTDDDRFSVEPQTHTSDIEIRWALDNKPGRLSGLDDTVHYTCDVEITSDIL